MTGAQVKEFALCSLEILKPLMDKESRKSLPSWRSWLVMHVSPPDCAPGLCCAPNSPTRMDPAPQRCKGCRKVFPNKDKLHGHLGRSARCLEACVSGSAGASAGGIANDSDSEVAMRATKAARFGDAGVRATVCEALASLRFSGRTPVSETVIQVGKDFIKDWLQPVAVI